MVKQQACFYHMRRTFIAVDRTAGIYLEIMLTAKRAGQRRMIFIPAWHCLRQKSYGLTSDILEMQVRVKYTSCSNTPLILFVSTANSHTIPRAGASSRMLPLFFCACFFSFTPHEIVHSENSRYPLPRLKTQGSEEQNIAQQLGAAHRAFRSKNTAWHSGNQLNSHRPTQRIHGIAANSLFAPIWSACPT